MNAFAETLSSEKWTFKKLEYNCFPTSKNGNKRGRLMGQSSRARENKFDIFYFDDRVMLFNNREDLEAGMTLLFTHFERFRFEMHVGRNAKVSITECMYFPVFNKKYQDENTEDIEVGDGYVSFTKIFKYLGLLITTNAELNDAINVTREFSQASKVMGEL
jgi:hypothetical protein